MTPRVVVLDRPTEWEDLLAAQGTPGQAAFFLKQRGQDLDAITAAHARQHAVLAAVDAAIPLSWRRSRIRRDDLTRFLFDPDDLVVAVGQDGLVVNAARYLEGQPLIGVNPDRGRYDGVLVRHTPGAVPDLLADAAAGRARVERRTMVEARLADGQRLRALNEIFVGHCSHQSARYTLRWGESSERQSSSGVVVSTGTGLTGWARSILEGRGAERPLLAPDAPQLLFMVREAFPSVFTGTAITGGVLKQGTTLRLSSEMNTGGTVFGDGIEDDRLSLPWGEVVQVGVCDTGFSLVA